MCILSISPSLSFKTGFTKSDIGKPVNQFKFFRNANELIAAIQKAAQSTTPQELRISSIDDKDYLVQIIPRLSNQDIVVGFCLTFKEYFGQSDIEIKLAETTDALALKNDIIDEALDGFDIVDDSGLIIYANKAYISMWGFENQEEVIGSSPTEHCLDPNMPLYIIEKVNKDGQGDFEFKAKRKDQSVFDVFMRVFLYQGNDGKKYYHGFSRDITKLKAAEDDLSKSKKLLTDAELQTKIGHWEWDIPNDHVYWSDGLYAIFQRSPKEGVPGWQVHSQLYIEKDFNKYVPFVEECVKKGTPYEVELRAIRSDGAIRNCIAKGQAIKNEEGQVVRLFGTLMDITEQKITYEKLRFQEYKVKEKERMTRELHHRIKNNLQMVSSMLYTKTLMTPDENLKIFIKDTINRVNTIGRIHNQLLKKEELNKLNSEQYLHQLAESVIHSMAYDISKYELELSLEDHLLDIDTITAIGLITNECLSNVIKHAYDPLKGGKIKVSFLKVNHEFHLKIEDHGKGFPAEGNATSNSVGLLIIDQLTNQLKGSIKRESNEGTTFELVFPAE